MNVIKKISLWSLIIGLCLPTVEFQAKKKTNKENKFSDTTKHTKHSKISGIISLLFPLPVILYNAGCSENESESSTKSSGSFFEIYYPGSMNSTTFKDVAGLDGAKEDMQDVLDFLKDSEKFTRMGAKIPKGLLMVGGPGNGKTLLARAVAGEINCPFIGVNGSDFSSMWAGVGADRIQELFRVARKNAPCIIFIDEIDAIATTRSNGNGGVARDDNKTIIALLTAMDGLQQYEKPVIVIAATNRYDQLDEAIVRPGRFDRIIEVTKPLIKDRAQLLNIALAKIPLSDDINIDRIARGTAGLSGAQLANLVNEAIILAVKDNSETLCMRHIEMAHDNITLGRETKGMQQTEKELWNTAVHEAGHLIGYLFQDKTVAVHKVSIVPRGKTLGVAHMLPLTETYSSTKEDMNNLIISFLAGRFAEEAFGFDLSTGAKSDLEAAQEIAYNMVVTYGMANNLRDISYSQYDDHLPNDIATKIHNEVAKIIENCRYLTRKLIGDHIKDIEKIAKLLIKKGTVQGDEIYELLNLPQPQGVGF